MCLYYLISFIFYKAHRRASEFPGDNALSPLAGKSQSRKTECMHKDDLRSLDCCCSAVFTKSEDTAKGFIQADKKLCTNAATM